MTHPRNIIGTALRKLRNDRGLSQAKLAEKCQLAGWDISREGIAKIEGRVRWVSDFEIVHLCKVLGAKPEILLGIGAGIGDRILGEATDGSDDCGIEYREFDDLKILSPVANQHVIMPI